MIFMFLLKILMLLSYVIILLFSVILVGCVSGNECIGPGNNSFIECPYDELSRFGRSRCRDCDRQYLIFR